MKFCVGCGHQLEDEDIYCGNCGQLVQINSADSKTKLFMNLLKHPVITLRELIYSLDNIKTIIISAILILISAFAPFRLIKVTFSKVIASMGAFSSFLSGAENKALSQEMNSKVNSIFFAILLCVILYFVLNTAIVFAYTNIRRKKEAFIRIVKTIVLSSVPFSVAFLLGSVIFGFNALSLILIIFGASLSILILFQQLKDVFHLSDLDSFIALVASKVLSYGITTYILFSVLKNKMGSLF